MSNRNLSASMPNDSDASHPVSPRELPPVLSSPSSSLHLMERSTISVIGRRGIISAGLVAVLTAKLRSCNATAYVNVHEIRGEPVADLFILDGEAACDGPALHLEINQIKRRFPSRRIMVVAQRYDVDMALLAQRLGSCAFVCLDQDPVVIARAVHRALSGGAFFVSWADAIQDQLPEAKLEPLTRLELYVVKMLVAGMSQRDIASAMSRSVKTISSHKRAAMRKLGVSDDIGLARYVAVTQSDQTTVSLIAHR